MFFLCLDFSDQPKGFRPKTERDLFVKECISAENRPEIGLSAGPTVSIGDSRYHIFRPKAETEAFRPISTRFDLKTVSKGT